MLYFGLDGIIIVRVVAVVVARRGSDCGITIAIDDVNANSHLSVTMKLIQHVIQETNARGVGERSGS